MKYYLNTILETSFEQAIDQVTEALSEEGFGVLTQIRIDEKFKEKLNVDFRKYIILGACNPSLAHQVLQVEDKVGLLLPCNVIVQQLDESRVEVAAMDPVFSMAGLKNAAMVGVARKIREKLERVIAAL